MYKNITIQNYRGFSKLFLPNLGRINLIVGKNNTGKSSVLEALYALGSGDPTRLFQPLYNRGERIRNDDGTMGRSTPLLDIRQLFYGRDIEINSILSIEADSDSSPNYVACRVVEFTDNPEILSSAEPLFEDEDENFIASSPLGLHLMYQYAEIPIVSLSSNGGLDTDKLRVIRKYGQPDRSTNSNAYFVTTSSLRPEVVTEFLSDIALTPDESIVIQAMQIIEPHIERVAISGIDTRFNSRLDRKDGVVVKLSNAPSRCPIGSMGDGVWRLLGLTLAALKARDGVLLIDEIDTGLHYTALADVWKLLNKISQDLNVQIFATTHSHDCVDSLSVLCESLNDPNEIAVHRLEQNKFESVVFTGKEILAVSRQDLEIR